MRKINSHHRTDAQLQKAKENADLANQAKTRHIISIIHELRTPLNSILGYAQILDGDPSIPAHRRQAVNVIRRSGEHLLSLIEGTLDLARIEGGRLTLQIKPLGFADFMQQIVRMFEVQARQKGIEFSYQPIGNLPAVVRADEKRLRQILINILGNAVKFTVHGSIVIRLHYAREMATFEIEDSGPGIADEEIERIFEPFVRGSTAMHTAGGTGLGLTIARMLTDLMGGELTARSTQGKGSTFVARLFLPHVHAAVAASETVHARHVGYSGERRRIMIVDNEAADRELLASILTPLGFELELVASGVECLEVLPRFCPHLIFMDLTMPGLLNGWQTIRVIRRDRLSSARIAIISATAFFDQEPDNELGIASDDFIQKPVNISSLLEWIGRALHLEWIEANASPAIEISTTMIAPPIEDVEALVELVELGYMRGIYARLDTITAEKPDCAEFVAHLRGLAQSFQLEGITRLLRRVSSEAK